MKIALITDASLGLASAQLVKQASANATAEEIMKKFTLIPKD